MTYTIEFCEAAALIDGALNFDAGAGGISAAASQTLLYMSHIDGALNFDER